MVLHASRKKLRCLVMTHSGLSVMGTSQQLRESHYIYRHSLVQGYAQSSTAAFAFTGRNQTIEFPASAQPNFTLMWSGHLPLSLIA